MKMLSHALKTTQKCHPSLDPVNLVVSSSQQLSPRFWLQFTHIPPPITHRQNRFTTKGWWCSDSRANDLRIKGFFSCLIKTRALSVWLTLVTFCGSHTFHRSAIPPTFKLSRVCKHAVYLISPDLDPSCAVWPGFRRSGAKTGKEQRRWSPGRESASLTASVDVCGWRSGPDWPF